MKGILAILMASIMMATMIAPAMSADPTTSATVGNVAPTMVGMVIEDAAGNDITHSSVNDLDLAPGGTVTITVYELVEDLNGYDDIDTVVIQSVGAGLEIVEDPLPAMTATGVTVGDTQKEYSATLTVKFYTAPGVYAVTNLATDIAGLTGTETESFEVSATSASVSVVNMVYDGDPCDGEADFDSIAPGNAGEGKHVVTNIGNIPIDFDDLNVGADGDDWELTGGNCLATYWPWDGVDETLPSGWDGYDDAGASDDGIMWSAMNNGIIDTIPDTEIRTTYAGADLAIGASSVMDVMFYLNTPDGVLPGTYAGTTTFTPSGV